jgi:glycosyltransferase involved in cell wall biosynthesis
VKKILYVDVPFTDTQNHGEKRSQFIWEVLCTNFDADLLLIKTQEYLTKPSINPSGFDQIYALSASNPNPFKPKGIHQFTKENADKFVQILLRKRYEMVFFRMVSCFALVKLAEQTLPECNLVMDVEYLFSHEAELGWQQNPVFRNALQKLAYLRLRQLENSLFLSNIHFFFANHQERRMALANCGFAKDKQNFLIFPDCLPELESSALKQNISDAEKKLLSDKFILFYGNLETSENMDAFTYLARDIYPKISKVLQEKDIKIYIVGNNQQRIHAQFSGGRLKLIGAVENLNAFIKASLFIILPLKSETGATTRILEAGRLKKTVLISAQAAQGMEFTAEEIAFENKTEDYCQRLVQMLQAPGKTTEMGQNLNQKVHSQYSKKAVEQKLAEELKRINNKAELKGSNPKLRIAVVTNSFQTEVSGIDTNIFNQVNQLAELYQITVFCPRRTNSPKKELAANVTIYRLFDVFNFPVEFTNHKVKTLCPKLFFLLLKQEFDLIICYPGINSNNKLALLAGKIKEIPVILSSWSIIDYADIFRNRDCINPDFLQNYPLNRKNRLFIRHLDYIFTVSEKEYAYLRKLNTHIEQVPIPVQFELPVAASPSLREKYNVGSTAFIFICLTDITYLNGQDIALNAFTKALPHLPDSKLVFTGNTDSEPEFMEEIESFIEREALQDDIIFTGNLDADELTGWVKEADISILPARFMVADTAAAESWMHGVPVLASDAVDPNLVIDGYNGYLFRSEDVEDLALQMQNAHSNKPKLVKLAEHGRALVKDKYSYDALLKRYAKIFKQLTT